MKTSGACIALAACLSALKSVVSFVPSAIRPSSSGVRHARGTSVRQKQQLLLRASTDSWFSKLFTKPAAASRSRKTAVEEEAARLKLKLLDTVRSTRRGVSTTDDQRRDIDQLIAALEPLNPNTELVTGESLSALWILEWTTEREILFLMEKGLLGLPSGPVQQAIDVEARTLSNTMLFGPDSLFEVSSSIEPEETGPRVNFEFEACKLRYRGFTVPLPPVGKGWFESVYLDEDFRVTRDVRGDVTVLVKSQE